MVFDLQGSQCVLINGEGMDFKPASIGAGRNQAHMKLLHAMAADGYAMGLGKLGHLKPAGDAASHDLDRPARVGIVRLRRGGERKKSRDDCDG